MEVEKVVATQAIQFTAHISRPRRIERDFALRVIYYEAYLLAKDAKARERFLKNGPGKPALHRPSWLPTRAYGSSR
ncbi:MAG: hypothetical protein WBM75_18400 [Polyangiales bacterium]